jgi:hypothetical protein
MRRRVDDLMGASRSAHAPAEPASHLSDAARILIKDAKGKVIPFVADADRQRLERLIDELQAASMAEETAHLEALEREMRNHAYLL